MRREPLNLTPVKDNAPLAGMQEPEDGLEQRGLPGAIGPNNAGDRPRLNAQPEAIEDVDPGDVAGDDPIHLKQRHLASQIGFEDPRMIGHLLK